MKKKGHGPCKVDAMGSVRPCIALQAVAEGNPRLRGVKQISLLSNFGQKNETIRHTYKLCGGEYPKGVMLNFCPFCGTDVRKPEPAAKAA
jgi:hypothetical protein